jgi:hypothetical protein
VPLHQYTHNPKRRAAKIILGDSGGGRGEGLEYKHAQRDGQRNTAGEQRAKGRESSPGGGNSATPLPVRIQHCPQLSLRKSGSRVNESVQQGGFCLFALYFAPLLVEYNMITVNLDPFDEGFACSEQICMKFTESPGIFFTIPIFFKNKHFINCKHN